MVKFFEENGRFLKGGEAVAVRVVALSSSGLEVEIVGTTGLFYIHGDHPRFCGDKLGQQHDVDRPKWWVGG